MCDSVREYREFRLYITDGLVGVYPAIFLECDAFADIGSSEVWFKCSLLSIRMQVNGTRIVEDSLVLCRDIVFDGSICVYVCVCNVGTYLPVLSLKISPKNKQNKN